MGILVNLKNKRKEKGYSQEQIAEKLGIQRETYANYENGKKNIPSDILVDIAKLLGISVDYLLGLTNYTSVNNEMICNDLGFTDETIENLRALRHEWAVNDYTSSVMPYTFSGGAINRLPRRLKDTLNLFLSSRHLDTFIVALNDFFNIQYNIPVHFNNGKWEKNNTLITYNVPCISLACDENNLSDTREIIISSALLESASIETIKQSIYNLKSDTTKRANPS